MNFSRLFHGLFLTLLLVSTACDCDCKKTPSHGDAGPDVDAGDGGPMVDAGCTAVTPQCGNICCAAGSFCDPNQVCCPVGSACGDRCCGAGEACEGAVCHMDCSGNPALRCSDAAGNETCCTVGQVCATGTCFTPTTSCDDFIDCPNGQYCELSVGQCLPQPTGPTCQATPMGSSVVPTVDWTWPASAGGAGIAQPNYDQVMMTPIVANITDDNNDGSIDELDTPDVLFISYADGNYTNDGILRAVNGDDGTEIFSVTAAANRVNPGGQLAVGDIDNDGKPEIVACRATTSETTGPLIAFSDTGVVQWISTDPNVRCGEAAPSIANLDGDGDVEVFVRYTVVRGADGSYVDSETCDGIGDVGATVRNEHDPCDYTTAANIDADPALEIVGGNVAFDFADPAGLTAHWDFRNCSSGADCRDDGYPAVADLDSDGTPEIVVVESSWLWGDTTPVGMAYQGDHFLVVRDAATGVLEAGPIDINRVAPPAGDTSSCTTVNGTMFCKVAGGGPPTIGNFDPTDARPEIALAGAYNYVVFDVDLGNATYANRLSELWHRVTDDSSSRKTGSSLFDFDGDGAAEVVYNDQKWLRVYDGATGNTRYCRCNSSATLWEYPVVADVDNDGHADIVVASNTNSTATSATCTSVAGDQCTIDEVTAGRTTSTPGVRVFRGPGTGWVATRRIWNQHTYHVTNITEAGRVPTVETMNWTIGALNNFRLNVQPGATNQPDLRPRNASVDLSLCNATMRVYVEVYNAGWAASPIGIPVSFYGGISSQPFLGSVSTTRSLLPGQFELLHFDFPIAVGTQEMQHSFQIVVNDPAHAPSAALVECQAGNNTTSAVATCLPSIEP